MCRRGHCLSHRVFWILCHNVFSQLVFLHGFLYVVPPSLFRSFYPKLPVLAISHRCGWVIASSSGQTTLVIYFLGTFQQVLCAPPSRCLHFLLYCWRQPVNLPHSWTVTRGIWRMPLWAVQHYSRVARSRTYFLWEVYCFFDGLVIIWVYICFLAWLPERQPGGTLAICINPRWPQ